MEKLTAEEIRVLISDIRAASHDDEKAHSMEDELHQYVLRAIAEGDCEDPKACAEAALGNLEISFSRWCA